MEKQTIEFKCTIGGEERSMKFQLPLDAQHQLITAQYFNFLRMLEYYIDEDYVSEFQNEL